jgi:3-oxoacyl-(acyl-carrier-protein) synthase
MAKVAKNHKTTPKRRRPSKKLVATLDSLADALPDAEHQDQSELAGQVHLIKHKTLKTRPGAMKRKEKMEQLERDRFMKNMSQMNTVKSNTATPQTTGSDATESNSTTSRWAALRGFISQTMEQQPVFKNAK